MTKLECLSVQLMYIFHQEPSLDAAVMLEQASYCYLLSIPPMLRKYGFHLVLSGNRYYISDQVLDCMSKSSSY